MAGSRKLAPAMLVSGVDLVNISGCKNRYLPDSVNLERLLCKIAENFSVLIEPPRQSVICYYDSFDWRLYNKKMLLQRESDFWHILDLDTGRKINGCRTRGFQAKVFAWDFPAGSFRTLIEPVLDVRAAMRLVRLSLRSTRVRVLNSDEKTVCYANFEEWNIDKQAAGFRIVRIEEVRGYEKQLKTVLNFLSQYAITEKAPLFYPFLEGVKTTGRTIGDYSSRITISLESDITAHQAAIIIFKSLFAAMMRNEEGIIKDYDSEFLHDFRIAIRKTRSCLTQFQSLLPPESYREFKEDFAYLGRVTGPTRDLDVYLLYERNYKLRLPEVLQNGLHAFFEDIANRRAFEQKKMQLAFNSPKYTTIIKRWSEYLNDDREAEYGDSHTPVLPMAKNIIYRRYKRIIKDGRAIESSSPDEKLHELRIQCKKLRYSLELFSSLFARAMIKKVIKQLKQLQTNLGDFNDLSIQQEMLRAQLQSLRPGTKKNLYHAAAIGGLLTNLYHEQQNVRKDFAGIFTKFAANENLKLFKTLFN